MALRLAVPAHDAELLRIILSATRKTQRERCRLHFWHAPQRLQRMPQALLHSLHVALLIPARADPQREHVVRPEPQRRLSQARERADQQSRPRQQHNRQSDLRPHKGPQQPLPAAHLCPRRHGQRSCHFAARSLERRQESEEERRRDRHREREEHDAPVQLDLIRAGQPGRGMAEPGRAPQRHQKPQSRARQSRADGLQQQSTRHLCPAGAQ